MIIKTSDVDYRITFKYDRKENHPVGTTCIVEVVHSNGQFKNDGRILGFGFAHCDSRDNFEKSKGRKISLHKALLDIPKKQKNIRKTIWNGYFEHVRK